MKKLLVLPLLLSLALALPGCAVVEKATQTFTNPVGPVQMYQVKNVYAAGEELALEYKSKCFGADGKKTVAEIRSDAALVVICNHRVSRWNAIRAAENKAYVAVKVADKYIADNPSGNAVTYITAAWKAVNDFKAQASR